MSLVERFLLVFEQPTTHNVVRQTLSSQWELPLSLGFEAYGITLRPGLELPRPESCLAIVDLNAGGQGLADAETEAALFKLFATRLDQWKARTDLPPAKRLVAWVEDQRLTARSETDRREAATSGGGGSVFDLSRLPATRSGEGVRVVLLDGDFSVELDDRLSPPPLYTGFVEGLPRPSNSAVSGHGDRVAQTVAGKSFWAGIAPGSSVWLQQIAIKNIVAANPQMDQTTLLLSDLVEALEVTRESFSVEEAALRPLTILLTPLQFRCIGDDVDTRCREVLDAFLWKLRELSVLWVSAAGNGGMGAEFFPGKLEDVVTVAAVSQGSSGRWSLDSASSWYAKEMFVSLPDGGNGFRVALGLTSGASSVAAGLLVLAAKQLPPSERTVERLLDLLRANGLIVDVYAAENVVGTARLIDAALLAADSIVTPPIINIKRTTMADRARQQQWRQIYKAIINDDNFWQHPEDDKEPDPMKSTLAHALHVEVRKYGRKWASVKLQDVMMDPLKTQEIFNDLSSINGVINRAVSGRMANPFAISHAEALSLYKILAEPNTGLVNIAPYVPPKDDGATGSAW